MSGSLIQTAIFSFSKLDRGGKRDILCVRACVRKRERGRERAMFVFLRPIAVHLKKREDYFSVGVSVVESWDKIAMNTHSLTLPAHATCTSTFHHPCYYSD